MVNNMTKEHEEALAERYCSLIIDDEIVHMFKIPNTTSDEDIIKMDEHLRKYLPKNVEIAVTMPI